MPTRRYSSLRPVTMRSVDAVLGPPLREKAALERLNLESRSSILRLP